MCCTLLPNTNPNILVLSELLNVHISRWWYQVPIEYVFNVFDSFKLIFGYNVRQNKKSHHLDARYVSEPEAVCRMLHFQIVAQQPTCFRLYDPLKVNHNVYFRYEVQSAEAERELAETNLTEWMASRLKTSGSSLIIYGKFYFFFQQENSLNKWNPRLNVMVRTPYRTELLE